MCPLLGRWNSFEGVRTYLLNDWQEEAIIFLSTSKIKKPAMHRGDSSLRKERELLPPIGGTLFLLHAGEPSHSSSTFDFRQAKKINYQDT